MFLLELIRQITFVDLGNVPTKQNKIVINFVIFEAFIGNATISNTLSI